MTEENKQAQEPVENNSEKEQYQQEPVEAKEVEADKEAAKEVGVSVEEFDRTRKALEKANREAMERRHKLSEWDELGVDPTRVKEMLTQQKESEIKQMEEEKRYGELLEKMREETKTEREKAQQDVDRMRQTVEREIRDRTISEAISSEDGIPRLLQSIVKESTKVIEENDRYVTVVMDDYGQPIKDDNGNYLPVKDFVKSMRDDPELSYAFKAPKVSGSNTNPEGANKATGNKPGPKKNRSQMSPNEKLKFIEKEGIDSYNKLPL